MNTACFSGYEPFLLGDNWHASSPTAQHLKSVIQYSTEEIIHQGCTRFLCLFNQGSDMLFAEAVIALKRRYLVRLESVLPHEEQAAGWSENVRERYFSLLAQCDNEILLQTQYSNGCQRRAVEYMVGRSDMLISVCDGKVSLSTHAVQCARTVCKPTTIIDPFTFAISRL